MSNNQERIGAARAVLQKHRELGWDNGDAKDDLVDLLANLMHYCGSIASLDFDDALRIARGHFETERKGVED